MKTRIQKWGNSLAVRIPKALADETGLGDKTPVEMSVQKGQLIVRPTKRPPLQLDDLLRELTPQNIHGEVDFGPSVGRERW